MKPVDVAAVVLLIRNEIGKLLHVNKGPKGDRGDSVKGNPGRDGKDGVSVKSIRENIITREAIITLDDGQQFRFKLPRNGKDAPRPPPPKVFHGKDGAGIREIDVSDKGNLIFNLTDGRTLFKPMPVIHARDGKDGTTLIHGYKAPRSDMGNQGDWYLDRANGDWWEKSDSWSIIYKNKRAAYGGYSAELTAPKIRYTAVDTTTTDEDEVIVCTAEVTVTLHTPVSPTISQPKRIKRAGAGDVTVTTVDASGYVLNINYQAVDVQWTGTEWISL